MSVRDLVRTEILELPEYGAVAIDDPVRLDNNESPWPAPVADRDINRYPAQPPEELLSRMAAFYGVPASQVLPTRGSDDAIDALIRCFCRPNQDSILTVPPTFGMYRVFASINGVGVRQLPRTEDFVFPDRQLLSKREDARLVFLCSPNNPTGDAIALSVIEDACRLYARRALVVIDEAYAEFMNTDSAVRLLDRFENLLVLRTLSKGAGLAGARVGALLGAPEILAQVRKVLPPYLLPSPCVTLAEQALAEGAVEIMRKRITRVTAARETLAGRLSKLPQVRRVFPSDANFLLVEFDEARTVFRQLSEKGIRVRAFDEVALKNCLRIAVGRDDENVALLAALEKSDAA